MANKFHKISIDESIDNKALYLMKHFEHSKFQDLVRDLINNEYREQKRNELRYGKGGPSVLQERKAKLESTIAEIKAMDPKTLLEFILDKKYVVDGTDDEGTLVNHSITEEFFLICEKRKSPEEKPFYSYSICEGRESIINALIKEKLI